LPAFNEEGALRDLLPELKSTCESFVRAYAVVVVDDGSVDGTAEIASRMSFHMPIRLIQHCENQGLAAALRTGLRMVIMEACNDDVIVTMDSDNSHPPALIRRLYQGVHEGLDVAIASRFQTGSRVVGVPWHRQLLSIGARCVFTCVFPIRGVRDYTCGYRAYRASVLKSAWRQYGDSFVSERGFSCMVDVLLKLRDPSVIMGELPLVLRYDRKPGKSKMRVLRTVLQTVTLVLKRRLWFRTS
jgi:dolichol-phosphate mannosyltransferase